MAFNMNPATTQIKYPFNGNLNPNEVFGSIYNMILFQEVKYPNLADNYKYAEKFKIEGSMFGDTALFYDQDILHSRPWLGDAEASNLLQLKRPDDPKCQAITLNKFRIIKTTLDSYLTKRAWATENAFTTFNDIVRSLIGQTKRLYEETLINTYIGAIKGNAKGSDYSIPLSDITATGEEKNRLEAQMIAQYISDLMVKLKDYSRDYNDYNFMRAYTDDEIMVIWNSDFINKITKLDVPTIFHKDGLIEKFGENTLPGRYFSEPITAANVGSVAGLKVVGNAVTIENSYAGQPIITYDEGDFVDASQGNAMVHLFAGEELPKGATFNFGEAGFKDEDVICKFITNDTIKYMAAFETATDFWNPQSLTTSQMLIWGFSEPARLYGQPCITVHAD